MTNFNFLLNSGDSILLNDGSVLLMNSQEHEGSSGGFAGVFPRLKRRLQRQDNQLTVQDFSRLITSKPYLLKDFARAILSIPQFKKNLNILSAKITSIPVALTYLILKAISHDSSDGFVLNEPADQWRDSGLEREKTFEHSSSFVGAVIYSAESQTMTIKLGTKIYGFCRVSERVYDSFKGSPSKGAYFTRFIKGQFDC